MRVVIQKVRKASVTVNEEIVSRIGKGLMVLVGISKNDTEEDVAKLSQKLLTLRIFEDLSNPPETKTKWHGKPWSKSLMDDPELKILSVSQFTLYGTIKKGTKPDFHKAAKGEDAIHLYEKFLSTMRQKLNDDSRVLDGKFGEMMDVDIVNDGPVTIVWDTNDGLF